MDLLDNDLHFNFDKCSVITFSRSSQIPLNYELNGKNLERVDVINDLRVIHDRSLNFHAHLEATSLKAHRGFGS